MATKLVVLFVLVCCSAQVLCASPPGFRVSGTKILDRNGKEFIMRGINHAHSFYKNDAETAIPAIAGTGANVVRMVLSNGDWFLKDDAESVKKLLQLCAENKLVTILEVHDATGYNDVERLERAANYFVEIGPTLKGLEDRVIINIANEWHGSLESTSWAEGYKAVVPKLRAAGLTHLLIVDAAGWGQYLASVAEKGREVFQADPLQNLAFSTHMYKLAGPDGPTVRKSIDAGLSIGVPLIVGEFGHDVPNDIAIAYNDIMQYCEEKGVGWLAWSWYGNDQTCNNMDLATGPAGELTDIGNAVVNGVYGIKATSKLATIW